MTQKQLLMRALDFVQLPYVGDIAAMIAVRAWFVAVWLQDMSWHAEAERIGTKMRSTPALKAAFDDLNENDRQTAKIDSVASLLSRIIEWQLNADDWKAVHGQKLVEELWTIINAPSISVPNPIEAGIATI